LQRDLHLDEFGAQQRNASLVLALGHPPPVGDLPHAGKKWRVSAAMSSGRSGANFPHAGSGRIELEAMTPGTGRLAAHDPPTQQAIPQVSSGVG
jgi:hypothetical protein